MCRRESSVCITSGRARGTSQPRARTGTSCFPVLSVASKGGEPGIDRVFASGRENRCARGYTSPPAFRAGSSPRARYVLRTYSVVEQRAGGKPRGRSNGRSQCNMAANIFQAKPERRYRLGALTGLHHRNCTIRCADMDGKLLEGGALVNPISPSPGDPVSYRLDSPCL